MTINTQYHNYITKTNKKFGNFFDRTNAVDLTVATISDIILKPISSSKKYILKDYKIMD
jgi:hypothetical protein